jgi:DNA-binding CsgD family transcriptional regulator
LNLVSKQTQQLDDKQLSILNTISELMGIAIQRTRVQESFRVKPSDNDSAIRDVLDRVVQPRMKALLSNLNDSKSFAEKKEISRALQSIKQSLNQAEELQQQVLLILKESLQLHAEKTTAADFHYPSSPLTNRELEVLALVKKGYKNSKIAEQLFIAERTVKFHITSILSKLLAKTRTEAVDIALQRGLLGI